MRVLLDTNVFLLFAIGSRRLSPRLLHLIEAQQDDLVVSAVTPWELAIEAAAGRLELPDTVATVYTSIRAEIRATELPITGAHALRAGSLPPLHADPFDRLLVAQAELERMILATNDRTIRGYGIDLIW